MSAERDPEQRLREMIGSLRGERREQPQPAPVPDPAPLLEEYRARLGALESQLAVERERSSQARENFERQEKNRVEVESQIRNFMDMLRQEKRRTDVEEDKSRAQGRVEALENRLDALQERLLGLIKESIDSRKADTDGARSAAESVEAAVAFLAKSLDGRISLLEDRLPAVIASQIEASAPLLQSHVGEGFKTALEKNSSALLDAYRGSLDETLLAMRSMMLKTLDALLEAQKAGSTAAEERNKRLETRLFAVEKAWNDFFNREPGL